MQESVTDINALKQLADSRDYATRQKALFNLSAIGLNTAQHAPAILEILGDYLVSDHEDVRMAAIEQIHEIARFHPQHREQALGALMPALVDVHYPVQWLATQVFASMREEYHGRPGNPDIFRKPV